MALIKSAKDIIKLLNMMRWEHTKHLMNEIKYEEIVENVVKHKCPGIFLCTVATTCYEEERRRAICLNCWLNTMKEREVEVLYDEEE